MKRICLFTLILLLAALAGSLSACAEALVVGEDIPFDAITDFYYTYSSSTFPPHYQRYRLYVEDGQRCLFHETRDGEVWPLTEEHATATGTVPLADDQWAELCALIGGGEAKPRVESLDDGDDGPWMYVYWQGGDADGWEYVFPSYGQQLDFEALCAALGAGNP